MNPVEDRPKKKKSLVMCATTCMSSFSPAPAVSGPGGAVHIEIDPGQTRVTKHSQTIRVTKHSQTIRVNPFGDKST